MNLETKLAELDYQELLALTSVLKSTITCLGHGVAYELNYSTYHAGTALKALEDRKNKALEPFFLADDQGNKITYLGKNGMALTDEEGNYIEFDPKVVLKAGEIPLNLFIKDTEIERAELMTKLMGEKQEVSLAIIPADKREKAFSCFEGLDLTPLFKLELV